MIARPSAAEAALQALGITEPAEIDVEVVARSLGAKVKYRSLRSCEARIVGQNGRAIITVDAGARLQRRRFSVAHELGHWHRHRGICLTCRSSDIDRPLNDGRRERVGSNPELQADAYASDLLLPGYIFRPLAADIERLTLAAVRELADMFHTSLTATAIRALGTNRFPALLVCHGQAGMRWFRRPPIVPERWFPRSDLQPESPTFRILFRGGTETKQPVTVKASCWFDTQLAERFTVTEQSFCLPNDHVATLVYLSSPEMLKV
ncbi:ImmA/IrrE family metallo-endopeptidase [Sphingomonas sp. 179-A 2A2 NHS]|uniref:ImmA/IrrE family metallo-endopeptidase n=1 Tax=Sphingomonas sp. 179-A 2A2 NHS TaxID=3374290 RepID=UPI00387913A6